MQWVFQKKALKTIAILVSLDGEQFISPWRKDNKEL
jgi:hypothetical protein